MGDIKINNLEPLVVEVIKGKSVAIAHQALAINIPHVPNATDF
ncbi:MAG: hypothetical protein VSS75_025050 [Candidatus Parabeggiatoa sp.]|nr:hypothetical protein [Candidatus Parabeggiatoa sp.]